MEKITSFQNPRLKQIKRLRERREREHEQRFVIDDSRDLIRALAWGYRVDYALICPALMQPDDQPVLDALTHTPVYEVSREMLEKAAYRDNPSAIISVLHIPPPAEPIATGDLILTLVDLRKPGNIGALLRTADATGCSAVYLVDTALDLYNPNIIRASTGACFLGNIFSLTSDHALTLLRDHHYTLLAAAVDGDATLYEADFGQRAAILLGTEDLGLPDHWQRSANQRVRIPMTGKLTDSLNVSVSGAIFMAEAMRRRLTYRPDSIQ